MFLYLFCIVLLLFIKFMLRCCGDCAFSASFVREYTDISYVAGDGVELTVHKESAIWLKIFWYKVFVNGKLNY